jgi:hypothetical protein
VVLPRDIPPGRIRRVLCFSELAGTSADDDPAARQRDLSPVA